MCTLFHRYELVDAIDGVRYLRCSRCGHRTARPASMWGDEAVLDLSWLAGLTETPRAIPSIWGDVESRGPEPRWWHRLLAGAAVAVAGAAVGLVLVAVACLLRRLLFWLYAINPLAYALALIGCVAAVIGLLGWIADEWL